jgi:hypothetical protein
VRVTIPFRLVLAEWVDSSEFDGWSKPHDWGRPEHVCQSVGWVIRETETSVTLAPHYNPPGDLGLDEQACGVMQIPRVAILSMQEIPMPRTGSKSAKKVSRAIRQVYQSPKHRGQSRAQKVAIGLSKARKRGARVPKKRGR